jgi:hypothetical protein
MKNRLQQYGKRVGSLNPGGVATLLTFTNMFSAGKITSFNVNPKKLPIRLIKMTNNYTEFKM